MAEVLLTQAVNQAEEAIESGNYGGAIEACQRILGQFPEFAGAHRIMGEAYAEQGEIESAREAFQRTLERDPQSIQAHLGLGMLSEDAGDRESALAYFQVAWEIDPRRRDLREHVSRISQQLYGADGRLYLTRAALSSLHFHAGRWDRTVSEAAQVLQEYPSRIDVQVRLAEALWRRGDDSQAKQVCNAILRSLPMAVVPLLVLADIHRHEGDHQSAQEFLRQARDIDPDGVRAADLIMVGLDDQADFLALDTIPTIDDQVVHEEPARYAPAPDFTAADSDDIVQVEDETLQDAGSIPPDAPEMPDIDPSTVQPFRWEDIGDEDLEVSDLEHSAGGFTATSPESDLSSEFSLPTDEELERARPSDERPAGYTSMLDSLDSEGVQPFDPSGGRQEAGPSRQEEATSDVWDDLTLPTDEELEQARPTGEHPSGFTGELSSIESEGVQPFDPFGDEAPPPSEKPNVETPVPPAEEDDWLSEFSLPSDQELEASRPGDEHPSGFTGMLDSLDSEGMQPFDPTGGELEAEAAADEPAVPELPEAELPEPPVETSDDSPIDLDDLGQDEPFGLDWSQIDSEIEEAIPGEMPRGYTDELQNLDDGGLQPFSFEEPLTGEPSERSDQSEGVRGDDEVDLEQMTADWEFESPQSDEPADDSDVDSIGVVFGDEDVIEFGETEPLRADSLMEEGTPVDESPSVEGSAWDTDQGFDELIAEANALSGEWAATEENAGAEADIVSELWQPGGDTVARETPASAGFLGSTISLERLGFDEALIERAREAKRRLVAEGRITGNKQFAGAEITLDSLRKAVEDDPQNIDSRIALANGLMRESPDESLEQFRWVYRNAPERGVDIVHDLASLLEIMREREVGVHRLLGAVYRRHGDWAAAATHYEESLTGKWRRSSK